MAEKKEGVTPQAMITIGVTVLSTLVLLFYIGLMIWMPGDAVSIGDWKIEIDRGQLRMLQHVALAMFLGGILGFERERAEKAAGLRTHMLVAGSAALLVGLGEIVVQKDQALFASGMVRTDPLRIVEAVVTAISFLGAGTIIRNRRGGEVHGLTTAASILFTAVIGISVAVDQLFLAVGLVVLSFVTLRTIGFLSERLHISKE